MRSGDPSLGWVRLLVRLPADVPRDAQPEHLRDAVWRQLGVADGAGGPWMLEPLFGTGQPDDLARWWVVGGAAPSVPSYDLSRVAYDLAARLAREPDLLVEPDLPSTAFGQEPATVPPEPRPHALDDETPPDVRDAETPPSGPPGAEEPPSRASGAHPPVEASDAQPPSEAPGAAPLPVGLVDRVEALGAALVPEGLVDGAEALGGSRPDLECSSPLTWALDAVRARDAWQRQPADGGRSRGDGIRIGHIDTGYTNHPELERAALDLTTDRDVLDDDEDARDPLQRAFFAVLDSPGHGTLTGSVIAGRTRGRISGVAPLATLVPIRAIKSVVQVFDSDVARAVNVARERGCHVVSMSLGGRGFFGLRDAIRAGVADGMIVMAAAGNQVGFVVAPASYPECLAVAATNCESRPWSGSSRGSAVDVSAPGESVWTARVDLDTTPPRFVRHRSDGTSFAVATLAGVAALWLAHHGFDRIRQRYGQANVQAAFRALVAQHGRRVPPDWVSNGWDRRYGVGIVDAVALLEAGLPDLPELAGPEVAAAEAATEAADQPVARLQAALGTATAHEVRTAVGDLLGIEPAQVDDLEPTVVSELVYRLGEDPGLRASLLAGAAPEALDAAPAATSRALLRRSSSLALRRAVPA